MKNYPGRTQWRIPLIASLTLGLTAWASISSGQTCSDPGDQTPAVPVPECVQRTKGFGEPDNVIGSAVACSAANAVKLWPADFQPAPRISLDRDTTQRIAGTFEPNARNGFELFKALDVVRDAQDRSRLYVAYSVGIQNWDITDIGTPGNDNPAVEPNRIAFRDGFEGQWATFPPSGEQLNFIEDIAALNVGSKDLVAVSGKSEVGISLWDYTPGGSAIVQRYQDPNVDLLQVRLEELNGNVYAFGAGGAGIRVYDATAASQLTSVCLEPSGQCPDISLGEVPGVSGTAYLDTMVVGNKVYLAAAGVGFSIPVEIWEIGEPSVPGNVTTRKVWSGLSPNIAGGRGPAFIDFNGHYYLAVVDGHKLKIALIDECVDGDITTCDSVPPPLVVNFPNNISPSTAIFGAAQEYLTFSKVGAAPFLYYGVALTNLEGTDLEQLWNLSSLPVSGAQAPLTTLPEITDGGGSYTDPCNNQQIRYWSHYYHKNLQGLRNMHPRIGKFVSGGPSGKAYFYRTAQTVLDVHIFGGGTPTLNTGGSSTACMEVPVAFAGEGQNGCEPTGTWNWDATAQGPAPNINPVQLGAGSQVNFRFDCTAGGRCNDAQFVVEASNTACSGALLNGKSITVVDPEPQIVDPIQILPAAAGNTYDVGQALEFRAEVLDCDAAQAPLNYTWEVLDSTGSMVENGSGANFTADTCSEIFSFSPNLFLDGFDAGSPSSWSATQGELYFGGKSRPRPAQRQLELKTTEPLEFSVRLTVSNSFGNDVSTDIPFTLTGNRSVDANPSLSKSGNQTDENGVDFNLTTNATDIRWEFQDAGGDCVQNNNCGSVCKHYPGGCTVINGGKSVNFGWREPNAVSSIRRVTVELSKCGSTPIELTDSVTLIAVPVDVIPMVTGFRIADSAFSSNLCRVDCGSFCGSGSSVQEISCKPNQPIPFEVTTTADGQGFNLDYEFDFDGNGTFESFQPTATVTFPGITTNYVVPQVKARIGSAVSPEGAELKEGSSIRRALRIQNF